MTAHTVVEYADRWNLGLRDQVVSGVELDDGLTVCIGENFQLRFGPHALFTKGPLTAPGALPAKIIDLDEKTCVDMVGTSVRSAVAFKSASVRLVLGNGAHINTGIGDEMNTTELWSEGTLLWSSRWPNRIL